MRLLKGTCQEHLVLKERKTQVLWVSLEASEIGSEHAGTYYAPKITVESNFFRQFVGKDNKV